VERKIHQDRALLYQPVIHAQVLDLSFLFLAEFIAPNLIILDIDILDKCAIEIGTVFVVIFGPFVLVIGSLFELIEAF